MVSCGVIRTAASVIALAHRVVRCSHSLQSAWRWMVPGLLLLVCMPSAARAAERPNFVILMTDDQRWDAMSCAGNTILQTPNMDRLAAEGMRFRNMFVTHSLCAPSRASLLTSLYSHRHGVIDNTGKRIRADQKILPDLLREAGYEVAFCGKSHIGGALRDRQWDYYFGFQDQGRYLRPVIAEGVDGPDRPYQGYMDDVVTDHALRWLEKKHEKPFCLFLWFKAPHRSWIRAPRHKDLFAGVSIPKPETWDERAKGSPGKPYSFHHADNVIGTFPDIRSLDQLATDYYSTLVAVDENVGRVLDVLTRTNQLDSTAVMYTSDNGFFLGEWQAFDKRFMHEPSIRVPLLVRYPQRIKPGSLNDAMVHHLDIAPTVLDLAGVPVPEWMQGRSLVPLLEGKDVPWRKDWLYEYYETRGPHKVRGQRGVRTERYKLIHYFPDPAYSGPKEEFELYDLEQDPGERRNLYGQPEYQELATQLRERLEELRRETGDQQ